MKELYNTLCTSSSLKLLVCEDLHFSFPLKYPKSKEPKDWRLKLPVTLAHIIKVTPYLVKSSFDERFDKKHPIELAVEQLYNKGLTAAIVYKILHNRASI